MSLILEQVSLQVDGQTHIHETDLALAEKGFNVLLGTTLAGKTSLMRLMAGLVRPSAGRVFFRGADVTEVAVQRRNVSMVYQQFINYPNLSVFDNIASPLRVAGLRGAEIRARVGPVAELLRLSPMLDRRPSELSGGQQQRCAMARALVKDADLVLFDEPLANLDYKLREELREELPRLFANRDCTVVYATTEPSEALLLGGHTAAMHEGSVTQFGPTGRIYRQPLDLLTATVFSDPPMNTLAVEKQGAAFMLPDGDRWPLPTAYADLADGDYTVGVRPHHVRPVADVATGGPQAATTLNGRVLVAEISGSESTVHFEALGNTWVALTRGVRGAEPGQQMRFEVALDHAIVFVPNGQRVDARRVEA
ncbi:MAG: ABC transporter ATP-binding protein [Burkholderiaceae bacterium]